MGGFPGLSSPTDQVFVDRASSAMLSEDPTDLPDRFAAGQIAVEAARARRFASPPEPTVQPYRGERVDPVAPVAPRTQSPAELEYLRLEDERKRWRLANPGIPDNRMPESIRP